MTIVTQFKANVFWKKKKKTQHGRHQLYCKHDPRLSPQG